MDELPLRDIHLPPPIGFWPPAPGWIGLAVLIVLALLMVLIRRRKKTSPLARAMEELERLRVSVDGPRLRLEAVNQLLKQAAMTVYGRESVAGLEGAGWREFLAEKTADEGFLEASGKLLTEGGYQSGPLTEAALESVVQKAQATLKVFEADLVAKPTASPWYSRRGKGS